LTKGDNKVDNNNQEGIEPIKVVRVSQEVMYPDNCIVVPKKDVIEMLKALEGLKRKLQPLLKA
jgi:hypothetical protein